MNTDSKTELLPCPFCGDHAETDFIPEHHSYAIECHSIGCAARVIKETASDAIEAWNSRAQASPVPQQDVEKLRAELAEEVEAADNWRRLALQFDAHRMQAIGHLKAMLTDPQGSEANALAFIKAPPLHGDAVLAQRIADIAAAPKPPEAATAREPLTDAEIETATGAKQGTPLFLAAKGFTIAIERAHGIGGKDT